MSDLIDTTEMYLRTLYELTEEGVLPMRARITERLNQSGPTVSQTIARMQRDGLVDLDSNDRHVVLTEKGYERAVRVMRKHRLAECLLVSVIGLPWEEVHPEACRWEHVMSQSVERRLLEILDHPTESPYGNPIPGLAELDEQWTLADQMQPGIGLDEVVGVAPAQFMVVRISEPAQGDQKLMSALRRVAATPGHSISAVRGDSGIVLASGGESVELGSASAAHVVVRAL